MSDLAGWLTAGGTVGATTVGLVGIYLARRDAARERTEQRARDREQRAHLARRDEQFRQQQLDDEHLRMASRVHVSAGYRSGNPAGILNVWAAIVDNQTGFGVHDFAVRGDRGDGAGGLQAQADYLGTGETVLQLAPDRARLRDHHSVALTYEFTDVCGHRWRRVGRGPLVLIE